MKRHIAAVMCSAVLAVMTFSSHADAQQKTAKACQEEWRANKAANQANGVTEKAYVAQCRGGGSPTAAPATPAAPAPAPTAAAPRVRPSATVAGQKTARRIGSRLAREVRSQTKRRRTAAADSLALWACGACLRCDGHRGQRPAAVLMPSPFTQRT
jgi:hypothetical protein